MFRIKYLIVLLYGTSCVLSREENEAEKDKVGASEAIEKGREAKQMWPFLAGSYYIQNGQSRAHVGSLQAHLPRAVIQPPPILSASGLFSKYTQQAPKGGLPARRPWQFRSALITSSLKTAGEDDKSKKLF